ncbi:hypothetical protein B7L44_14010 [Acinetobacter nosocomialis]|uniref:hypothetical protein n=1 Tax=Acinetobacter nosocomialis TaxID=106654 RepID=UPI0009E12547|nr:hypothetical protein [Acinetobacter nosocomialis]ARG17610.1 hypothetical protein B7L44_14010 [Acinetobacter nosocomialis]
MSTNEREAFEEAYLNVGGKQHELELEDGEYTNSKSQLGWELWQIKTQAIPNQIINEIQSWVAVKSFPVEDAHPDLPIIDANELAEFIDQLVKGESGAKG